METLLDIFSAENLMIVSVTMLATATLIAAVWLAMESILGDP